MGRKEIPSNPDGHRNRLAAYLAAAGVIGLAIWLVSNGFDWRYLLPFSLLTMLLGYLLRRSRKITTEQPPLAAPVQEADRQTGGQAGFTTAGDNREQELADVRLLLVSQRPEKTRALRQQLSDWGIDFKPVSSSVQAFSELFAAAKNNRPYQTVLVDAAYLDMDDCQFATALRIEPALQSLYLVHYGGNPLPGRAEQLYSAGWSKLLRSPVDKTLLFSALHSAKETGGGESNVIRLLDHYQSSADQQPLDILLGCHNNSECQRIRKMLTGAGHQTFVVSDSSQILDALENHHFDLAILEQDTGDISGTEAIKLYRFAHIDESWIPFILLLDNPTSATMRDCEVGGIEHLLVRPVSASRLFESISCALQDRDHEQEICSYPASRGLKRYHNDELILDTHQLEQLQRLGKDPLFLVDLINQFVEETDQLLNRFQTAIGKSDLERARSLGHQLKDTAGNLGALSLYRLSVRATRITGENGERLAEQLLNEIASCRTATIRALHEYLAEGDNPAYRKD